MSEELKRYGVIEFLLWLVRSRRRFRVTGNSMLPLLKPGDEILINPQAYRHTTPRPGDIVVAWHPQRPNLRLVKRVVDITADGRIMLQGDNPAESTDSRFFGPVAPAKIVGQVTSRFE